MGQGARRGFRIRSLLTELRIRAAFALKGDDQGSIKLTKNPEFHQRTGHIPLEEHFIRDEIEAGHFNIEWVPTEQQLADGLTKIPPIKGHTSMIEKLGLEDAVPQGVRFDHPT